MTEQAREKYLSGDDDWYRIAIANPDIRNSDILLRAVRSAWARERRSYRSLLHALYSVEAIEHALEVLDESYPGIDREAARQFLFHALGPDYETIRTRAKSPAQWKNEIEVWLNKNAKRINDRDR